MSVGQSKSQICKDYKLDPRATSLWALDYNKDPIKHIKKENCSWSANKVEVGDTLMVRIGEVQKEVNMIEIKVHSTTTGFPDDSTEIGTVIIAQEAKIDDLKREILQMHVMEQYKDVPVE